MTELIDVGGCGEDNNRIAQDGAGQGDRDWLHELEIGGSGTLEIPSTVTIIISFTIQADDMNDSVDSTFKLRWRNVSDAGSFADLASTGEIKWATVSDLIDGNAVVAGEDSGANVFDCIAKAWSRRDGLEKEGANGFTRSIAQDAYEDFQWAVALDSADFANNDDYELALTQSDNTVIATGTTTVTVVTAGKIDGITKNDTRSAPIDLVTVSCFESDQAGSDPKPIGEMISQVVSDVTTGVYSLTGLVSGRKYFLHFYKDDTDDLSDGSIEVTAVDV
jgi:hypothetical protein